MSFSGFFCVDEKDGKEGSENLDNFLEFLRLSSSLKWLSTCYTRIFQRNKSTYIVYIYMNIYT
jgi:hypothetical protein